MAPIRRPNKFAARCAECDSPVVAGDGWLVGKDHARGPWLVAHNACPSEGLSAHDLADRVDGMWDTLACRSEVGECIDEADRPAFDAETRAMAAEAHRLQALLEIREVA